MIKQILVSLFFICAAFAAGADDTRFNEGQIPTIIVFPDTFSEANPVELENKESTEWQILRTQLIEDSTTTGIFRPTPYDNIFSIAHYKEATVILLKSPRVETILERQVLAERYFARLNLLAGKWPADFSQIIFAGIGRGAEVAQTILNATSSSQDNWIKNVKGVVTLENKTQMRAFTADSLKIIGQSLMTALKNMNSNLGSLNKGLTNINKKDPQLVDNENLKRVSKIYSYYLFNVLSFMGEMGKIERSYTQQAAVKVATLTADIVNDDSFKTELMGFMKDWITNPDDNVANELISALDDKKLSDIHELVNTGTNYKRTPMIGQIYYRALKQAVLENNLSLAQANNAAALSKKDLIFKTLNSNLIAVGNAVAEIQKGLTDIQKSYGNEQANMHKIDFNNGTQQIRRDLIQKIVSEVSTSTSTETGASL
ncbi:MAG: hypothetical protein ACXVCP_09175 [Bdellovibrio sp.]